MIISYLLIAALSPAPGATTPRDAPAGVAAATPLAPRAIANLASYISDADYPAEAIRREEQGTVHFRLHVTPEGRVGRCEITATSGSTSLDETTCRVLSERARFTPARDSNGSAVADEVDARIRWVLPEESVEFVPPPVRAVSLVDLRSIVGPRDYPPQAGRAVADRVVDIALVVAPDGRVEQCAIGVSSGSPLLDDRTCELVQQRARFKPARDASGAPAQDIVQALITWRRGRN